MPDRRQPYPIGDLENGQIVQVSQGPVPLVVRSIGHQQLTVSSAPVMLTVPYLASRAAIVVQTDAVRWRADGTAPTASVGIPQAANSRIDLTDPMADYKELLGNLQFIRVTTDATLDIEYFL